jgi:hypothetical protein
MACSGPLPVHLDGIPLGLQLSKGDLQLPGAGTHLPLELLYIHPVAAGLIEASVDVLP